MTAKILYFPTISEPTERAMACCTFCGHFEEISLEREIAGDVDGPTWCDQCGHYSMVGGEWEVRHAQVEPMLFFEQYDVDDMLITVSNDADKLLSVYYGRYGEGTEPRELSAKLEALLEENPYDSYSINNLTAVAETDGSVTLNLAPDGEGLTNHLYIMDGWNYVLRLYRPRKEVLDGTWTPPPPQPVA